MIEPSEFIKILKEEMLKDIKKPYVLGKIGTNNGVDKAHIIFDGEVNESGKEYITLGSYIPNVNDRVLLAKIDSSYIILGKIGAWYNIMLILRVKGTFVIMGKIGDGSWGVKYG